MPSRYIHSRLSSRQVPDLLACIFVAELMTPSRSLWLVSPWISDIPRSDRRATSDFHQPLGRRGVMTNPANTDVRRFLERQSSNPRNLDFS